MLSKRAAIILKLLFLAPFVVSCHSQGATGAAIPSEYSGGQIIIDKSGQTYINNKKIVVGLSDDDISYKRITTIILGKGREQEVVRDCSAIAVIKLNGDERDTLTTVNNVTVINRDTIVMHTKGMVDKYRSQIRSAEHPERPYQYLRFLGMMSEGEGNKLINEGVIEIVFDHDPTVDFRVYGFGICGNANSVFINRGEIRFRGKGTPLTRMRGMGSMADNVTFINEGTISVEVDMAEDVRMITTGGDYNDIINNGLMYGRTSGTLIGMTRYGNSNISNNGTIDLTVTKMPGEYKSVLARSEKFVCGLFEMLTAKRKQITPMNNRGTITLSLNGTADEQWTGYGMYFGMLSPCDANITINNVGSINLNQNDANITHCMAEAGFISRTNNATTHITIGKWRTAFREFSITNGLFQGSNVSMDFGTAEIQLEKQQGYVEGTTYSVAPESLLNSTGNASITNQYIDFDNVSFTSADNDWQVNRNKKQQTLSLSKE